MCLTRFVCYINYCYAALYKEGNSCCFSVSASKNTNIKTQIMTLQKHPHKTRNPRASKPSGKDLPHAHSRWTLTSANMQRCYKHLHPLMQANTTQSGNGSRMQKDASCARNDGDVENEKEISVPWPKHLHVSFTSVEYGSHNEQTWKERYNKKKKQRESRIQLDYFLRFKASGRNAACKRATESVHGLEINNW